MNESPDNVHRFIGIGLAVSLVLVLPGCGPSSAKLKNESSMNMKVLGTAIISYQSESDGESPDSLDDVKEQANKAAADMGLDKDFAALIKNPLTGDDPGYEYVKPAEGDSLDATVMLYQLRDGKRDESLPVCYQSAAVK